MIALSCKPLASELISKISRAVSEIPESMGTKAESDEPMAVEMRSKLLLTSCLDRAKVVERRTRDGSSGEPIETLRMDVGRASGRREGYWSNEVEDTRATSPVGVRVGGVASPCC